MTYGPKMVLDAFFAPWPPEDEIGGWYVQGHDANDVYQEYVVRGAWKSEDMPKDWIDWVRCPIKKGNVLLEPVAS